MREPRPRGLSPAEMREPGRDALAPAEMREPRAVAAADPFCRPAGRSFQSLDPLRHAPRPLPRWSPPPLKARATTTWSPVVDASGISGPLDRRPATSSWPDAVPAMGHGYREGSAKVDGVGATVPDDARQPDDDRPKGIRARKGRGCAALRPPAPTRTPSRRGRFPADHVGRETYVESGRPAAGPDCREPRFAGRSERGQARSQRAGPRPWARTGPRTRSQRTYGSVGARIAGNDVRGT